MKPPYLQKITIVKNKTKAKAFTLIELLVVVAIIGILAAVGVVAYNGYTSSAKRNATLANFKTAGKFIGNTLKLCDAQGGTINLSPSRSINCDITNNASGINQMADVFKNYFLDQSFINPYDNNADSIIRTGSGGDKVDGRLRLDETECSSGNSKKKIALWVKTHKDHEINLFQMDT